jgi:hypothetical protein
LPRLVPKRVLEEPGDDSDHPPDWPHPNPHSRLRILETFKVSDGTTRREFVRGEYAYPADPLVLEVWGRFPNRFEEELVS